MKSSAIELHSTASGGVVEPLSTRARVAAYVELTKPRITSLIVLTSAAGFVLGSRGTVNYAALVQAMIGIALLSSGIATLNQYMERDLDGLMRRTAGRPLPTGRLFPVEALCFGILLSATAEIYLAVFANALTAFLG
jgi:protoheme IX farnesyltransferase